VGRRGGGCERETERDRKRDRESEKETDRQRDRAREREILFYFILLETDRQTDR